MKLFLIATVVIAAVDVIYALTRLMIFVLFVAYVVLGHFDRPEVTSNPYRDRFSAQMVFLIAGQIDLKLAYLLAILIWSLFPSSSTPVRRTRRCLWYYLTARSPRIS